jgi:hypothetical protein
VIPRLWVCTSHPVLTLLTLPLHPMFILAVICAQIVVAAKYGERASLRLRRLWQGLLLASVGGFALLAIPAWVVAKLGADPSPIVDQSRYVWLVLALSAVAASLAWGAAEARAFQATETETGRARSVVSVRSLVAFSTFGLLGFLLTTSSEPWILPYNIGAFFFDAYTTDLASNECLAFRAVDDAHSFGRWYPGNSASYHLIRRGPSAVRGIADYISDRLLQLEVRSLNVQYARQKIATACDASRKTRLGALTTSAKSGRSEQERCRESPVRAFSCSGVLGFSRKGDAGGRFIIMLAPKHPPLSSSRRRHRRKPINE